MNKYEMSNLTGIGLLLGLTTIGIAVCLGVWVLAPIASNLPSGRYPAILIVGPIIPFWFLLFFGGSALLNANGFPIFKSERLFNKKYIRKNPDKSATIFNTLITPIFTAIMGRRIDDVYVLYYPAVSSLYVFNCYVGLLRKFENENTETAGKVVDSLICKMINQFAKEKEHHKKLYDFINKQLKIYQELLQSYLIRSSIDHFIVDENALKGIDDIFERSCHDPDMYYASYLKDTLQGISFQYTGRDVYALFNKLVLGATGHTTDK